MASTFASIKRLRVISHCIYCNHYVALHRLLLFENNSIYAEQERCKIKYGVYLDVVLPFFLISNALQQRQG